LSCYYIKYSQIFTIVCLSFSVFSQAPSLKFVQDTTSIGKEIKVSLSFSHPYDQDVFFPKSEQYFNKYILIESEPIETKTVKNISLDSVVYTLKTFEINDVQTLQLPVWQVVDGDSVALLSNVDTIYLKSQILDSLLSAAEYRKRLDLVPSSQKFNYALVLRWFSILLGIVVFFFLFLKRPLEREWLKWKFRQKHAQFTQQFRKSMKSAEDISSSMALWKSHMEWLDQKPYTTLSTSEITIRSGDERLGEALREIDSAMYGGQTSDRILIALQILYNEALEKYRTKRKNYYKSLK
jgi:hypothetical protein